MAIKLYQEQAPFTNKRLDKEVSKNGTYSNPVIAPFAFDFTSHVNTLECVIYIRNDSQEHYYKNLTVSLMKESGEAVSDVNGRILSDANKGPAISINGYIVPVGFSTEEAPAIPEEGIVLPAVYKNNYVPVFEYSYITKKLINEYWIASANGEWDTDAFVKDVGGNMELSISGAWHLGFRPDQVSVEFTDETPKEWRLYDTNNNIVAGGSDIANDSVQNIDFSADYDISKLVIVSANSAVSNITFYYDSVPVSKGDKLNLESTDNNINVKFSYGYDELNEPDWDRAKSVLTIPLLGNSGMPDISYHPVRMRIIWKNRSPLLTVRDYFIDISYQEEAQVGA